MYLKSISRISAVLSLILLLAISIPEIQERKDPFLGIEDEKVLPMLRNLPAQHGGGNIPAIDGRFLYDLVVEKGYKRGLEIGTSNGYSSLWIGLALKQNNGSLVTLEINPLVSEEASRNFVKAGLDGVIEVITADALKEIPKVPGTFDFVFMDALHTDNYKYLYLLRDRVIEGGAITTHDVISRARIMEDYLDAIQNDPGLETTIHRVGGAGISVSIVKTE